MSTNYIAPIWRMPRNFNKDKLSSYSLSFDGSNKINFDNNIFSGLTSFSFAGFYNTKTIGSDGALFGSYGTGINQILFYYDAPLGWRLLFNNGSLRAINSGFTTTINEWHFIAGTFNNTTGEAIIYYNNDTFTTTVPTGTITSSTLNWALGADGGGTTKNFEGKLSQISFYDYALSPTQVGYLRNLNNPMAIDSAEPIAYYPMGDNSNPTATAGYPNISVGADSVFDFSTSGDWIDCGNNPALNVGTGDLSISAWVYPTSVAGNDDVCGIGANGGTRFRLQRRADHIGAYIDSPAGQSSMDGSTNLTINTWHHFVLIKAGSNIDLYLNGNEVSEASYINSGSFTDTEVAIGQYFGGTGNKWAGELSNIQIWNSALTTVSPNSDLEKLYNNGQPLMTGAQPQEANLQAWYKLNQTANWEADTVGNWQIPDNRSAYPQSMEITGHTSGGKVKISDFFSDGTTALNGFNFTPAPYNTAGDKYAVCTISWWQKLNYNPTVSGVFGGVFDFASQYNTLQINPSSNKALMYLTLFNVSRYWTIAGTGATVDVSDQKWHHYCLLIPDAATNATARLFIDNNELTGTGGGGTSMGYPMEFMQIGTNQRVTNSNFSNVQVFNSILSDPQIELLYNKGIPLTTTIATNNLKAWYKLDNTSNYINYPQNLTFTPDYWSIDPSNITPGATEALNFSGGYQNTTSSYEGIEFNDTPLTDNKFIMSCWYNSTKSTNDNSYIYHNYSGGTIAMQFSSDQINIYANPATVGSHMMRYYLPATRTGWHHLVIYMNQGSGSTVNLDNTDNLKLYVDGSEISVGLVLGDVSAAPVRTEANRLGWTAGGNFEGFQWSNWALLVGDNAVLSAIPTLYNGGTPGDISSLNPTWWYKLNSSDVSFPTSTPPTNPENVFTVTDSSGNGNTTTGPFYYAKSLTTPSQVPSIQTVNVVSNQGISSGMTEQNLVNNNVSVLNGESSGMDTTNLVQSNLTRKQPFSSYSINFDGTSEYIDCGPGFQYSDLTISGWLYADSISTFRRIIQLGRSSGGIGFGVAWDNSSKLIAFWNNGTETVRLGNTSLSTGNWYHFGMTRNSTEVKIYVNGVDDSGTGGQTGWGSSNNNLEIGRKAGGGQYMDGKLSNIAIFNEVLTSTEMLKLYNNGVPQDLNNFIITPEAWYPMDQSYTYFNGSVLAARDVINGNDGTGVNIIQENILGNAPGSSSNGTGSNLTIVDLKCDMKSSINNSYSINMADYGDPNNQGVTPANSGRSTNVP